MKIENYFALRDGKIVLVDKPPHFYSDNPDENFSPMYQKALQSAIANGIEVENGEEVYNRLWNVNSPAYGWHFRGDRVYYMRCKVEIINPYPTLQDDTLIKEVARVTFDEQPKDDHIFKCDCHYPCDNYPHCGGHKITFDEQVEKKEQQKELLSDLMKTDEEYGMYEQVEEDNETKSANWRYNLRGQPEAAGQEQEISNLKEHIEMLQSYIHGGFATVKIVCYCGSLRVALEAFKKAEYDAVIKGEIALLPCCMFVDIQREYGAESDYKIKADEVHKRKIDICDEVFVLNVGGYIGESTRSEIEYAKKIGKPIKYLEP